MRAISIIAQAPLQCAPVARVIASQGPRDILNNNHLGLDPLSDLSGKRKKAVSHIIQSPLPRDREPLARRASDQGIDAAQAILTRQAMSQVGLLGEITEVAPVVGNSRGFVVEGCEQRESASCKSKIHTATP